MIEELATAIKLSYFAKSGDLPAGAVNSRLLVERALGKILSEKSGYTLLDIALAIEGAMMDLANHISGE